LTPHRNYICRFYICRAVMSEDNVPEPSAHPHSHVPNEEECLKILAAAGANLELVRHCKLVARLAVAIAKRCSGVNIDLVRAGALLHDLGRAKTQGTEHAVVGAEIVRELNLPDDLVLIIERHIGAGITMAEAERAGLPPKDYVPQTLEEKIVAHADNLTSAEGLITISRAVELMLRKGLKDGAERMYLLHRELSRHCGVADLDEIVSRSDF